LHGVNSVIGKKFVGLKANEKDESIHDTNDLEIAC